MENVAQRISQEAMANILSIAINALMNIANTGGTVAPPPEQKEPIEEAG